MGAKHSDTFTDHLQRVVPDGFYLNWTKPTQYDEDKVLRKYDVIVKADGGTAISFSARTLPGCCGVLTVFYLNIQRDATIEKALAWLGMLKEAASNAGYGSMLMSLHSNSPLAGALKENGWVSAPFLNHKTGNNITILSAVLPVSKKKSIANLTAGE
jgi:hypothetical protein